MSWKRSFIHVVLAVSVGANVWLLQRITALEASFKALAARPRLQIGTRVQELNLREPDGSPFQLQYGDVTKVTALYVLSPTCNWCVKNANSLAALAKATEGHTRWIAISLTPRGQSSAEKVLLRAQAPLTSFPLYTGLSDAAARELRLRSTPTTIVISPQGTVLALWEGAYTGKVKDEIEAYFKVSLPDLLPSL